MYFTEMELGFYTLYIDQSLDAGCPREGLRPLTGGFAKGHPQVGNQVTDLEQVTSSFLVHCFLMLKWGLMITTSFTVNGYCGNQ